VINTHAGCCLGFSLTPHTRVEQRKQLSSLTHTAMNAWQGENNAAGTMLSSGALVLLELHLWARAIAFLCQPSRGSFSLGISPCVDCCKLSCLHAVILYLCAQLQLDAAGTCLASRCNVIYQSLEDVKAKCTHAFRQLLQQQHRLTSCLF
jgi:hypothetical protein